MKAKKLAMVVLSLALGCTMLTACSSQEATKKDSGGAANAAKDKVTIRIYYPTPDKKELRALEDDKIKRFEAAYPNVKVVPDDWQYNVNEVGIKMAANEAPTFFNTFATEAKMLVDKGWAADVSGLWNSYKFKDQINPVLQNQFVINGKVYGVIQKGYVVTTVVNKKMLQEKGITVPSYDWTWDDMLNTAKALADPKKGISGIAPMGKGNEAGWNWTNFLFEANGEIQKVEGSKVQAAFNSEAGVKALEFYKKLRWEANAVPQDWALGWGEATGAFAQGRTGMVIAGAEGPLQQALQAGLKPQDLLVYPMPAASKGGKHTGVLGGDYLIINPNASKAEQEAAFNYIVFDYFSDAYLQSLEKNIQEFKAKGQFFVPPHMDYYKADSEFGKKVQALLAKYDNVYKYDEASNKLLDGKPEAQFGTQEYYAAMTNVIQEVFSKRDANSQALIDAAAKLVQDKVFGTVTIK